MIEHDTTLRWRGTAQTQRKKDLVLELLAKGMSLYGACLDARIPHNVVYMWRRMDAAFGAACLKAIQISAELRARERDRIREGRLAEQERRMAKWRPVNRIAP